MALRARQKRNFLATLLLSQGIPMLLAGDEIGHTQQGNNNAYCQDNEISWINWKLSAEDYNLHAFAQMLIALRAKHPVFHRRKFFQGRAIKGADVQDIFWLGPDGKEMTDEEWKQNSARCLGLFLSGDGLDEVDERAQPIQDESFLVLMNAGHEPAPFALWPLSAGLHWVPVVDTACEQPGNPQCRYGGDATYPLEARSLVVLAARAIDHPETAEAKHEA
jgi:glycogen operon protein